MGNKEISEILVVDKIIKKEKARLTNIFDNILMERNISWQSIRRY